MRQHSGFSRAEEETEITGRDLSESFPAVMRTLQCVHRVAASRMRAPHLASFYRLPVKGARLPVDPVSLSRIDSDPVSSLDAVILVSTREMSARQLTQCSTKSFAFASLDEGPPLCLVHRIWSYLTHLT